MNKMGATRSEAGAGILGLVPLLIHFFVLSLPLIVRNYARTLNVHSLFTSLFCADLFTLKTYMLKP